MRHTRIRRPPAQKNYCVLIGCLKTLNSSLSFHIQKIVMLRHILFKVTYFMPNSGKQRFPNGLQEKKNNKNVTYDLSLSVCIKAYVRHVCIGNRTTSSTIRD